MLTNVRKIDILEFCVYIKEYYGSLYQAEASKLNDNFVYLSKFTFTTEREALIDIINLLRNKGLICASNIKDEYEVG